MSSVVLVHSFPPFRPGDTFQDPRRIAELEEAGAIVVGTLSAAGQDILVRSSQLRRRGVPDTTIDAVLIALASARGVLIVGQAHSSLSGLGANDHDQYQLRSAKGMANGYAALGADGRVPVDQLSLDALQFKDCWDANANDPPLASGVGTLGDVYIVDTAGTTTLDGVSEWFVGDQVIFNGTAWKRVGRSDAVTTVAGKTGDVQLEPADIGGVLGGRVIVSQGSALAEAGKLFYDDLGSRLTVDGHLGLNQIVAPTLADGQATLRQSSGDEFAAGDVLAEVQAGGAVLTSLVSRFDGAVHALFRSDVNQYPGSANIATTVAFEVTESASGVTISGNQDVEVQVPGRYIIYFFGNTYSATLNVRIIRCWLRIGSSAPLGVGDNVAGSTRHVAHGGTFAGDRRPAIILKVADLAAGTVINAVQEISALSGSPGLNREAADASPGSESPSGPSALLALVRIGDLGAT